MTSIWMSSGPSHGSFSISFGVVVSAWQVSEFNIQRHSGGAVSLGGRSSFKATFSSSTTRWPNLCASGQVSHLVVKFSLLFLGDLQVLEFLSPVGIGFMNFHALFRSLHKITIRNLHFIQVVPFPTTNLLTNLGQVPLPVGAEGV